MSPMTAIGRRPHRVTFQNPGPAVQTPDGTYTQTWTDLAPPALWMAIEPATARALEQIAAGAVLGIATHLLRGPYHPQIAAKTRARFKDRIFEVTHVQNPEQADKEVVIVAVEVLSEPKAPPSSTPYRDLVIADGAIAYWRLNDPGPTAADLIGVAHGTIVGGVAVNQSGALGEGDPAMGFDGTTGCILAPALPPLNAGGYSYEAWIHPRAMPDFDYATIVDRQHGGPAGWNSFELVRLGTTFPVLIHRNGLGSVTGAAPVAYGAWHYAVLAYSASRAALYLDGDLDTEGPLNSNAESVLPLTAIGSHADQAKFFDGLIDEVAVYPRALTAQEVAAHYAAADPHRRRPRARPR